MLCMCGVGRKKVGLRGKERNRNRVVMKFEEGTVP